MDIETYVPKYLCRIHVNRLLTFPINSEFTISSVSRNLTNTSTFWYFFEVMESYGLIERLKNKKRRNAVLWRFTNKGKILINHFHEINRCFATCSDSNKGV